jgi:general secretion pathway protein I
MMQRHGFISRHHRPARAQRGFTLIEAIVALVLIATTGMALFSWINTNIITLNRVQLANAQSSATANVLDYMAGINPMATPQGSATLGDYRITWDATVEEAPRDGAGYPYGVSLYQIALYQTKVTVLQAGDKPWFDFTLTQTGYKRVRSQAAPM